jgi:hypothetical protein
LFLYHLTSSIDAKDERDGGENEIDRLNFGEQNLKIHFEGVK